MELPERIKPLLALNPPGAEAAPATGALSIELPELGLKRTEPPELDGNEPPPPSEAVCKPPELGLAGKPKSQGRPLKLLGGGRPKRTFPVGLSRC